MNKIEELVLLQKLQRDLAYIKYDKLNLHNLLSLQVEVGKRITQLTKMGDKEK